VRAKLRIEYNACTGFSHGPDPKAKVIMAQTIHAIYENGVFRPVEPVDLPERCEVEVEVRQVKESPGKPTLDDVYAILGRRHSSGEHDLAARHNEHLYWFSVNGTNGFAR
jgi:predicted DNA-binding antitoxin AbrB/MazE fold protein